MMDVGTVADEAESVAVGRIVCGDAGDTVLEGSTVLGGGVVGVPVSGVVVALVLPLLTATGVTELAVSAAVKGLELAVEIEASAVPEVVVEAEDCVGVTLAPVVNGVEPVVVDPVVIDIPEVVVAVVAGAVRVDDELHEAARRPLIARTASNRRRKCIRRV